MTTDIPTTLWTPVGEIELSPVPAEEKGMLKQEDTPAESSEKATSIPTPAGYRILCFVPQVEKTFGNGLIEKTDATIRNEELLCAVLFAAKLGPDCYKDPVRFPSGPWCKEGDFILVRPMVGTRVKIHGRECRIINDDCVEAVVADPRGISRSF